MSREIVISISNWDKYNPRKDLKSMPWIRLQGDIAFSESLFGLDAEAKWLWIFLLSYSTKKLSGDFKISEKYLSHHSGVSASKFNKYLGNFLDNGLISIKSNTSRITNESVRITNESVPNERTNETNETNITNPSDPISSDELFASPDKKKKEKLDFELIYAMYPRKEGKKKGVEKLKREVTTREKYAQLEIATNNYAIKCKDTELKFMLNFYTFSGRWEDYVELQKNELKDFTEDEALVYFETLCAED